MEPILELDQVAKTFPGFELKEISFQLPHGRILGMIGENGAGKTTTIQLIMNILRPDAGKIRVFGHEIKDEDKALIGVVFSDENFYDTLQLGQIAHMLAQVYQNWNQEVFQTYCERFHLPEKKQIKDFSRGMKVKLHLAIALSHHPKLLILDEPTSGLDAVMREELMDILLEFLQDETHAILISSHISSDLEKIADAIMFIKDGSIVFIKDKDTLLYQYGIVHCTKAQFVQVDPQDYCCFIKHDFSIDLLVEDKVKFLKKYKNAIIDTAGLDTIMLMYAKGEKTQ